jgi:hypothetical protein
VSHQLIPTFDHQQGGNQMKVIAQLIALSLPDSNPAQIAAALCISVTYLKTNLAKFKHNLHY